MTHRTERSREHQKPWLACAAFMEMLALQPPKVCAAKGSHIMEGGMVLTSILLTFPREKDGARAGLQAHSQCMGIA